MTKRVPALKEIKRYVQQAQQLEPLLEYRYRLSASVRGAAPKRDERCIPGKEQGPVSMREAGPS